MAKDPAFLFYPSDWLGGTMGMTFEEKGAYIDLLMMQFNRGHMTSHMIGQTVGQLWVNLKDKFVQDEKGLWFNVRLEVEKENRKKFTESRRNNLSGENQYTKEGKKPKEKTGHKTSHMTYHMEDVNINEDVNTNKDFGKSENLLDGEEIIPTLCRIWYNKFPSYAKDQTQDFKAVGEIVRFMIRQHAITDLKESRPQIEATFEQIANFISTEKFWKNKALKSIANSIQEFYNKIKNGKDEKQSFRESIQAEFNRRYSEAG